MTNLFDIDPTPPEKYTGDKCKNCIHLFRHQYNPNMMYCNKRPDPRTTYKRARIKANDAACERFERKTK